MTRSINEILALKIRQLSDTQVVYTYYLGSFENYTQLLEVHPTAQDGSLAQTKDTNVLYFYNGTAWAAVTAGGVGALNDLTDVTLVGPVINQIMYFNGTSWINGALPSHDLDSHSDVNTVGATNGQFLKFNGIQWVAATATVPTQLSDLSDVNAPSPTNGNVLIFDSGAGEWIPSAPSNPTVISDLTDVSTNVPINGQVFTWNNAGGEWEPRTPVTPATAIDDLTDVTITGVATDDILKWNGSAFVNVSLTTQLLGGDYKGSYALSTDLSTAYPSPTGNQWALVNGDVWIHDGIGNWENTSILIWAVDASTETELETLVNFDVNNEYTNGVIITDDLIPGKRHKHSSVEGVWFEVLEDATWHRIDLRMPRESLGTILTPTESDASASTSIKKISMIVPFNCYVQNFIAGCMVAPTGSTTVIDVHYEVIPAGGAGISIFSTKPTIDDGEYTTETAATSAVISTTTLTKGSMIHFYVDQVGSTTAGRGYSAFLNVSRID